MTATLPQTSLSQAMSDTQKCRAEGPNFPTDHDVRDIQDPNVGGNQAAETDQTTHDTQSSRVGLGPILWYPILGVAAEVLDDLERVKNANANRLRQLTRTCLDKDGLKRGLGLTTDHPDVLRLAKLVHRLEDDNTEATKNLEAVMKAHPLYPWCQSMKGVGPKTLARLLAAVGDPYWNSLHNRPRLVSELWAYCGMDVRDGQAPRHRRGEKSNWSDTARMRIHLIAESCMKNRNSPYRHFYDETREHYADATHQQPCTQCGTKGKPAEPGTPLKDGHKHARALRAIKKEALKDLWREAKRLHEQQAAATPRAIPTRAPLLPAPTTEDSQNRSDAHRGGAVLGSTSIAP